MRSIYFVYSLFLLVAWFCFSCGGGGSSSNLVGSVEEEEGELVVSSFKISLPVKEEDLGVSAYRIWPFGVHGSVHATDGHPGWDIEVLPNTNILAAGSGVVQSVTLDEVSNSYTVQISHQDLYRSVYTNLDSVNSLVVAGATVNSAQVIGVSKTLNLFIGTEEVVFSMTHFQFDDFSKSKGITNKNAVNPFDYLNDEGQNLILSIWQKASYNQEIIEPFLENDRESVFPFTRIWNLKDGTLITQLEVTAENPESNSYSYKFLDENNQIIETGDLKFVGKYPFSEIDFVSIAGGTSYGLCNIVDELMSLAYQENTRPSDLSGASTYTTEK